MMHRRLDSKSAAESRMLLWASWLYEQLLFAYPAQFRHVYREPIAQLFRDEARRLINEKNTAVFIQFLLHAFFDLTKTILIEHLDESFNLQFGGNNMPYHDTISSLSDNPEGLENLYHDAIKAGQKKAFKQAINDSYHTKPNNRLFGAWFHRLNYTASQAKRAIVAWQWVIPLALFNAFWFWLLSDDEQFMIQIMSSGDTPFDFLPAIILWGATISSLFVLIYLTLAGRRSWMLTAVTSIIPLATTTYVQLIYAQTGIRLFQEQYLALSIFHLIGIAWASIGLFILFNHCDAKSRMQVLLKSLELFVVSGIFFAALSAFFGITIGLFAALDIQFSDSLIRLIFGGGVGLIVVITSAIIYNPRVSPNEQVLNQGFFRLISVLMQALLPLTLIVLVIYLGFIPANFRAPFDNRDVLITYNIMLFAVVGLLVGATIVRPPELSAEREKWLRRMIIGVAVLTLVVSFYALSAIIFRTINDRLTPNRLTIIGWNLINIGLLIWMLILQLRADASQWIGRLYQAFSQGTAVYALYALLVILVLPWLFGINQGKIEALPESVQNVIFVQPSPVLLKCTGSPHIYLLDGGEKRWIKDIETFNGRGYLWGDVSIINCTDLGTIPDGVPIPVDADLPDFP